MNWQTKRLIDVVSITSGTWGTADNQGTAVLRSTNFTNEGDLLFDDVAHREIPKNKISELNLRKGDILLEKSGGSPAQPVGRVVFFDEEQEENIVFGNFISRLRPSGVNNKFLFYFLLYLYKRGDTNRLQNQTTGIRNLILKKYLDIEVPLPAISIQQQIVEKLDAIRKLQELNQEEIGKAEELFISVVSKWFKPRSDWKVKKLEEVIISMQSGYASRPISEKDGIAQIRPHNITREGLLTIQGIKYVPFVRKDNYLVKKGDVIFNNTNSAELVGKTAYIDDDIETVFSNHMTRIRVNETKINPYFLATYLHTLYQSRYFQGLCTVWVNQAAINSTLLKGLKIPLPPIEKQKKIVGRLSMLKDYKNTLRIGEVKLTELFESVLNKFMRPN